MADRQPGRRKRRRWRRILIGAAGVLLGALLANPIWLPWLLKPVAGRLGIQYTACHRQGYSRLAFDEVHWENARVRVQADQVSMSAPHRWLWARWMGTASGSPQVVVQNWRVKVLPADSASPSQGGSASQVLDEFRRFSPRITAWLHSASLTNGRIELPQRELSIPSAGFENDRLRVHALGADVTADLSSLPDDVVKLAASHEAGSVELELARHDAEWGFEGAALWQSNHIELSGEFDRTNWIPAVAVVRVDPLRVRAGLTGLSDAGELRGAAKAQWSDGAYEFQLGLSNSILLQPVTDAAEVSVDLNGHGDLVGITVDHLAVESPVARASLDEPLTLDYAGHVRKGSASLRVWADLGRIKPLPLSGLMSGDLTLEPTVDQLVRGRFTLKGADVAGFGVAAETLQVSGRVSWPLLELDAVEATFPAAGVLAATGTLDLQERHLENVEWRFDGATAGTAAGSLRAKALHAGGTAAGMLSDPSHSGWVEMETVSGGVFRADAARLEWRGQGLNLGRATLSMTAGGSSLTMEGAGQVTTGGSSRGAEIRLSQVDLQTPEGAWNLEEESEIRLQAQPEGFTLEQTPLRVRGPAGWLELRSSLDWPLRGSGQITIEGLQSTAFADFLSGDAPQFSVPDAEANLDWDNGPIRFQIRARADIDGLLPHRSDVLSLRAEAGSDGETVRFDSVRIDFDGAPAFSLTGQLPLRIDPARGWTASALNEDSPAEFNLHVAEQGPLWTGIEELAGIKVESPSLTLKAHGHPQDWQARLSLRAGRISLIRTNSGPHFHLPSLDALRVDASAGPGGFKILDARAGVLGQTVTATGEWRIAASNWSEWVEAVREPDLTNIAARIRLADGDLGELAAILPGVLSPQGTLDLDLGIGPGSEVRGSLALRDAATAFLKPVGALRGIDANIDLHGQEVALRRFDALLGGRPVVLSGDLDWRPDGDRRFDLHLTGKDLSLVRDPQLFLRADVDVRLRKAFGEVARVSGTIGFEQSLLFRDFNALVGFNRDRPEQRPPYFSIRQAPFGDWRLDLQLHGDRFLRVLSPAFKGVLSAGLRLQGTLREPLAVGAVTVDEGKVLFPFGTLDMESGRVDLTREDPYRPYLDFRGEGQNFGYTITVDLTGPADSPNLTFQSVPPLTAQQILLMLSAGEVPRSDFGYSTADKASRVGFYVGKEFVNRFVGNTSVSERLLFRSGENVTDEGKPTYSLEYRLTDRWSVFGEYDRFQDFNSGLRFNVLSK